MLTFSNILVSLTVVMLIGMLIYILRAKNKRALHYIFILVIAVLLIWNGAVFMGGFHEVGSEQWLMWEKATYFGSAFVPVCLVLLGLAYGSKKEFTPRYLLLLIVPVVTIIMVWTNDFHHLFYSAYTVGEGYTLEAYFFIHTAYSYICLSVGLIYLCYFAIKNSGILSTQAVLIIAGSVVPLVINVCYTLQVPGFDATSTPAAFSLTVFLYLLGMFRLNLLKLAPIALQTVINRISDSFIVLDPDMNVMDYNQPFVDNFDHMNVLRKGRPFKAFLSYMQDAGVDGTDLKDMVEKAANVSYTLLKDIEVEKNGVKQYFTVEFTPILKRNRCIAVILLFKNMTQHVLDMQKIQENQTIMMEKERLASLGQLIGGIAHNLKTPIMSLAGGIDQLQDLTREYRESVGDHEVTAEDHFEIAEEMQAWQGRMRDHLAYMSDIISTVKDQATQFSNTQDAWFTLDELLKRVRILMLHELSKNKCVYAPEILVHQNLRIKGDINSMVQILDNIIVNAIQAYEGKGGKIILRISREEDMLLFLVRDFAKGIEEEVRERVFREMVTTKGKHGTGLGLYMSYSTIKGMFRGNMWFESVAGKGTDFYIQIPIGEAALKEGEENA
ncbi:MAG: histidine kinase N-terminal 7TM domain-containing protein [Christensenellales bacterium]|jgi:two-component system sensor histidine kinase HupT/HoxJ